MKNPNDNAKFILLRGIKEGNQFFTTYHKDVDHTKSKQGETWYEIIGYATSIEDAQTQLYGRTFPIQGYVK